MQRILLPVALLLGGLLTYVDRSPGWDDTGVMAGAIFLTSGVLGYLGPRRPWVWALALGVWIPLLGIVREQNYGSLLALVMAFAGAYAGMAKRRAFSST